ncbi:MAG: vacuolar family H+-ATPase subunit H [Lachnospiraceae bacterium]|nr:vacuolar family H+-ATPase subunit H [Lachnospiraceae bacterium]
MSRIEQLIGEIEAYLDGCKVQAFSGGKSIVVEKDIIDDMMAELRMRTPEEIKKYQKIIANKDAILADARKQSDEIIEAAKRKREQLVNEHEIMQQAYEQADDFVRQAQDKAQEILDEAVGEANAVRESAMSYTDDQLANLETILSQTIEGSQSQFESFLSRLQQSYDLVASNRRELAGSMDEEASEDKYDEEDEEETFADENEDE